MRQNENFTSAVARKLILRELQVRLGCGRVVGSQTLLMRGEECDVIPGYYVDVINKYGELTLDCAVRIYWNSFSVLHNQISSDAPYATIPLKKWEMSAIICGFDEVALEWPKGGVVISNPSHVGEVVDKIENFCKIHGHKFFERYASVSGMFELIQKMDKRFPGTWRPSLEFLLRKELFGVNDACSSLREISPRLDTGYERHQAAWLSEHQCIIQ